MKLAVFWGNINIIWLCILPSILFLSVLFGVSEEWTNVLSRRGNARVCLCFIYVHVKTNFMCIHFQQPEYALLQRMFLLHGGGNVSGLCGSVLKHDSSIQGSASSLMWLFLSLLLGTKLGDLSVPFYFRILSHKQQEAIGTISTGLEFWWIYLQGWIRFLFLCLEAKETYVF